MLNKINFILGDIRNYDSVNKVMKDVDFVIHAAALKHVPAAEYNPTECIRTNIQGAENIIKASIKLVPSDSIIRENLIVSS